MKRENSIFLLLLCFTTNTFAQQYPGYSQYVFDGLLINPAYARTREVFTVTAAESVRFFERKDSDTKFFLVGRPLAAQLTYPFFFIFANRPSSN
jgi:hypothetical protein